VINTITIGKTVWAMGLTWRSYGDRPTTAELREDAEDLKADLAAVRISPQVQQAGFIASDPGQKRPKNVYALAAAVADAREQPWLGIFRVGANTWWYIAVREGQAVLPDGDVVGDEEAIMAARANHESYADWTYVRGDLGDIRALIDEQGKSLRRVPLKSLSPTSLFLPVAGVAAALLVIGGGIYWWQSYEAEQAQQRAAKMMAERELLSQQQAQISPLVQSPVPSEWLAECVDTLEGQPISVAAWTMKGLACNANSAIITWQREDGATVAARPSGAVDNTGNTIIQMISLPDLPSGADNAAGLTASNLALLQLLQPLGIHPTISPPVQPQPLPGAAAAPAPAKVTPEETVSMTTSIQPTKLPFDQVPGLRLDALSINDDGDWIISGELYGR